MDVLKYKCTDAGAVLPPVAAVAALFSIVACTPAEESPVTFSRYGVNSTYDTGVFGLAAGERDLLVVIAGNPFGGDQARFDQAAIDAMQGRNLGQPTNFTTTPESSANENYRVVMVFNPPADLTGTQACQPEPPRVSQARAPGGRLELFAAFCRTTEVMTQVAAAVPAAEGPGDPMFVELVGQTTRALFPQRSRFRHRRK